MTALYGIFMYVNSKRRNRKQRYLSAKNKNKNKIKKELKPINNGFSKWESLALHIPRLPPDVNTHVRSLGKT